MNEAWKRFGEANFLAAKDFAVGADYLEVCERAHGECSEEADSAAAGIRRVLGGEQREFSLEYPCHSPNEQRWFRLMVTPVADGRREGAVVMHVNITERRLAEEELREKERTLREQAVELRARNEELTRFNRAAVGRELRMIELKREINGLCERLGLAPPHRLPDEQSGGTA